MNILIGLDVGTTNTKAVAFAAESGRVVAEASRPTPYVTVRIPPNGRAAREIDSEALWEGVVGCLQEIGPRLPATSVVRGVGVASMAEAGVPLDSAGRPLARIIPWNDPRTQPQLAEVLAQVDEDRLYRITGQAQRYVYSLFKLIWIRQHIPDVFARLHRWLSVADYIAYRLTGNTVTDLSLASRTMLFDQRAVDWSPELLALAGLRAEQLPTALPAGRPVGEVTQLAAERTGLPTGIAVAIGGHDHLCGAFAAGVDGPGQIADSIGTAESVVLPVPEFCDDTRFAHRRICCYHYVVPGLYAVQAGMANSGGGLEWIARQTFADLADPVAAALEAATRVMVGADGLLYYPYLGGNGAPVGDENISGCLLGLRPTHERGHLVRAVLEGIAFGIRDGLEVIAEIIGTPAEPLRAFGGGSRSPFWLQLRADVLGKPIQSVEVVEAVALGAALLAGVAAGDFRDTSEAARAVERHPTEYVPDPSAHTRYDAIFHTAYREIYPTLRPLFTRIAKL